MNNSSAQPEPDVDVFIIGMGPVGKMIGLLLARAGHSVLITDRKQNTYGLPRAVAHDAEIARILQTAGLPPDSMPEAVEPYDDMYIWVNGEGEILHEVDWRGIGPSGWHNTYFYNQPSLEEQLDSRLRAFDHVDIRRGVDARVEGQDESGVNLVVTDLNSQASTSIRARFALGADGANSSTRERLGIEWNDLGYFFDWLVIDIRPDQDLHFSHLAKQVCDPHRPTTVVPGGPGRRRWEFMRLEGESVEELTKPERIWQLLEPFGVTAENAVLDRGVVYTFNSGWASEWRRGRVLLLGDAAHLMPPFAGQGLAAGFRDCLNLFWKLDLVLRGIADEALLGSYESERQPHVEEFINFSMELGKIICITDPASAAQRDHDMMTARAQGAAAEPPPDPRLGAGVHQGADGGTLSWQGNVLAPAPAPEAHSRFDDVYGPSALIVRDTLSLELDAAQLAHLRRLGISVVEFGPGESNHPGFDRFTDVDGTYGSWLAQLGASAVLVRPDFYLFGTAATAPELNDLVSDFIHGVMAEHPSAEPETALQSARDDRG